jgi:hypothetical protein
VYIKSIRWLYGSKLKTEQKDLVVSDAFVKKIDGKSKLQQFKVVPNFKLIVFNLAVEALG